MLQDNLFQINVLSIFPFIENEESNGFLKNISAVQLFSTF